MAAMAHHFSKSRLVAYRHAFRVTQRAVGDGVCRSTATVKGWESGDRTPPAEIVNALCDFFGIARGSMDSRYDDPGADYLDAVADASGTLLPSDAVAAVAAVLARAGRVRGHVIGVGAA